MTMTPPLRDPLTGVESRAAMLKAVEQAFQRRAQEGFALLQLNLDRFKRYNDVASTTAGDQVLKRLGQLLSEAVAPPGRVGRVGGEWFWILLPGAGLLAAESQAQALRRLVARAALSMEELERLGFNPDEDPAVASIPLTATLSVTLADAEDRLLEELLVRLDHGMQQGKHEGRNQVRVCVRQAPSDLEREDDLGRRWPLPHTLPYGPALLQHWAPTGRLGQVELGLLETELGPRLLTLSWSEYGLGELRERLGEFWLGDRPLWVEESFTDAFYSNSGHHELVARAVRQRTCCCTAIALAAEARAIALAPTNPPGRFELRLEEQSGGAIYNTYVYMSTRVTTTLDLDEGLVRLLRREYSDTST